LIEDCDLRLIVVRSLRSTDGLSGLLKDSIDCNVFGVELSTVYVSERVQIPAARFSEAWGNFFGLKRFAKTAEFVRFGSSRGVRSGLAKVLGSFSFCCKVLADKCEGKSLILGD